MTHFLILVCSLTVVTTSVLLSVNGSHDVNGKLKFVFPSFLALFPLIQSITKQKEINLLSQSQWLYSVTYVKQGVKSCLLIPLRNMLLIKYRKLHTIEK